MRAARIVKELPDTVHSRCRLSVLAVIAFREPPERAAQLGDRHPLKIQMQNDETSAGQPFADQSIVLLAVHDGAVSKIERIERLRYMPVVPNTK
jgi:hypothetical protein